MKQIAVLPPDRYADADIAFIVPRVLELTYTAHDLKSWADDLGYDGPPFTFDPDRRSVIRAELDAWYARAYGLNRDELRYILDPADVMGADYPSETFRVLKNNEMREFGEYRTGRLVLREFDRMALAKASGEAYQSLLVPPPGQQSSPEYSAIGTLHNQDDARMAGLVLAMVRHAWSLPRQTLGLALAALQQGNAGAAADTSRIAAYRESHASALSAATDRLQEFLRFFETAGAIRIQQQGTAIEAIAGAPLPSGVLVDTETKVIAGLLLQIASATLERQASLNQADTTPSSAKRA